MSPSRFPPSLTVHLFPQLHQARFPLLLLLLPLPHPLPVADYVDRKLSIQDEQGRPIIKHRVEAQAEQRKGKEKTKQKKRCLVWRISVIINEIAAHPPDFTEFLVLVSIERLERRWCRPVGVDEGVVEVVVVVLRVGVEGGALGEGFEDGFDYKQEHE